MNIDQFLITEGEISYSQQRIAHPKHASFVLVFTSRTLLETPQWLSLIYDRYPDIPVVSCSTSGEIYESDLYEESVVALAVQLEKTVAKVNIQKLKETDESFETGKLLGAELVQKDLKHILVFSDGWRINGSDLIRGIYSELPAGVTVSGGLAGDGANFSKTLVGLNDEIEEGIVVGIGLYGDHLAIGFGNHGGWSEKSEPLEVTGVRGRELYKLSNQNALKLYREFMGDDANGLPGKALLYPLAVTLPGTTNAVVRTVFNVDEIEGSISLGEPVPSGSSIQFMRAQFDDLLSGVEKAAKVASANLSLEPQLALVVSCIGRKLLFDKRIEEELTITQKALGDDTVVGGFYSYGEICPIRKDLAELHHQMLTVTLLAEKE